MQFEQKSSRGHVLEPSGVGAPVPDFGEFFRELLAMPVRMSGDHLLNEDDILRGKGTALNAQHFRHRQDSSKEDGRESSEIMRAKSENSRPT
jgi:hypothetical protein